MIYRLCEGVSIEEVDECKILITEKGDAAMLNETAGFIIEQLFEKNFEEVLDIVAKHYEVEIEDIKIDVKNFINEMISKRLIEQASNEY